MAKLIFILDGNVLREIALDKKRMTIGRRSSNDIQIDNLAVSGQHAELSVLEKDVYLVDLSSTNGTLVNDKAITKHVLKHGDIVAFGKYQLKFVDEAVVTASNDGFADTVLIRSQADKSKVSASTENNKPEIKRKPAPIVVEENTMAATDSVDEGVEATTKETLKQGYLKILSGEKAGQDLMLDKTMIKVGTPGAQLAVITRRQQDYFISHVAGDNHPLVNGQSIGMQAYALNDHDQIEVEGVKMELNFE